MPTTLDYSKPRPRAPVAGEWMLALGMTLTAILVGIAIHIKNGSYDPVALEILTFALLACIAGVALAKVTASNSLARKATLVSLAVGIFFNTLLLGYDVRFDWHLILAISVIASLAILCLLPIPNIKHVAVAVTLLAYLITFGHAFKVQARSPAIDVYQFQQQSCAALAAGKNPYAIRFHNIYDVDQTRMFYGPGVVDKDGNLTYGFPYPPLTLLMAMPGYLIGGDCRYSHLFALLISAALMAYARPGRLGVLAAAIFLLTPRAGLVLDWAWTEPVLLLNFSLAMFCACRWRKGLPCALGLFFATKQYSVLALPALLLLVEGPAQWRQLLNMVLKAGIVVAVINIPFLLWNPHEFWRAVVDWQFVQPFRMDALSYLVWLRNEGLMPGLFSAIDGRPRMWIPFAAVIPAAGLALWRCGRTPAGFAAAVTLIDFVFFALNKQAFCNYYFFVIATACWSVAALDTRLLVRSKPN